MPKQLYNVVFSNEIVVLAENEDEAREVAEYVLRERRLEMGDDDVDAVSPMSYMPGDWDLASLPFKSEDDESGDVTLGELIKAGAAPSYERMRKRLEAIAAKEKTK